MALGLGLATRAHLGYATGVSENDRAMAQQLALSGLEDFRVKAALDLNFPPSLPADAPPFAYGESLRDSGGTTLGRFQVQVSTKFAQEPTLVYRVKSTGFSNRARVVLTGVLDRRPGLRWLGIETEDADWFP